MKDQQATIAALKLNLRRAEEDLIIYERLCKRWEKLFLSMEKPLMKLLEAMKNEQK